MSQQTSLAQPVSNQPGARVRWLKRTLVCLLLIAGLIWGGGRRIPTGPEHGIGFQGMAADASEMVAATLRLGTYNIHGGRGTDGKLDLDRICQDLAGVDLVGLNEVRGPWYWQQMNQSEQLAQRLEMSWIFAPTERRWWHYEFGNGVLSRIPTAQWQRIPLARHLGKSFRNVVYLQIPWQGVSLQVLITHIDRSNDQERFEQLRVVGDLFLALHEPVVLMGDLNTQANEPPLARLLNSPGVHDALGDIMRERSGPRIDWILTRGLRTIDAGLKDSGASDHPHLWADVQLANPHVAELDPAGKETNSETADPARR